MIMVVEVFLDMISGSMEFSGGMGKLVPKYFKNDGRVLTRYSHVISRMHEL